MPSKIAFVARGVVGLLLAALVVGCSNRVVSDEAWFARDEQHAPRLRPGLWVEQPGSDCSFDERQPAETWADCATSFVVREQDILHLNWVEIGAPAKRDRTYDWSSVAYVLAAGDPVIQQVTPCLELGPTPVAADGLRPTLSDPPSFCYSALRPGRFDAVGRIVSFDAWPVYCGPWPTEEATERVGRVVTTAPFPGIHVVYENCTAENQEALRTAAQASEAIAERTRVSAHWVRDGYH